MVSSTTAQETLPLTVPAPDALPPVEFAEPNAGPTLYTTLPSPVGEMLLTGDGESLTGLFMVPKEGWGAQIGAEWRHEPERFRDIEAQLRGYFAGELRRFSLRLAPSGTPFQLRVWQTLTTIPYGRTASYGAIASAIDQPTASRAVGAANGRNPISIIVPCHRVVGANGTLTGYSAGLPRKRHLLDLERRRSV
ncbi:methylated-DNA--[protein]-cysteine S-methyltransferase [Allosalinactinospora lopnorensis]|uniref:methylated-DNA--[protein]-cysteine S-methyltransferase n=1 Tax=Allosalinactinospora lopnorensis TaxID=1352348 RepID=UPI000623ED64|nr:methylated-DNA--[protein]-cysteine S-methyltransferase [Allosalinactinospora lopnorensis]